MSDSGGAPGSWYGQLGVFVATCAWVGYAPVAPGTFGSLAGLVVYAGLRAVGSLVAELAMIAVLLAVGIWSSSVAERHFGHTDPGHVVIDEVVGMLVTLVLMPVGPGGVVAAFFVFRVLDIVKPWPARRLERLQGGLGIMADDVMAGLYGNLIVRGLLLAAPGWMG